MQRAKLLAFVALAVWLGLHAGAQLPDAPLLIRAGCEVGYPPFCLVDAEGRAAGFSVELLRAAVHAVGRDISFRTGTWSVVQDWLDQGALDALPLVGRTPEREARYDFTVPYLTMHGAIVVRQDTTDVHELDDLRGRCVAVMRGDNAEEFLRRQGPAVELVITDTFADAIRDLSEGRCDAVVVQRLVALRLIAESGLTNLRLVDRPIPGFSQDFCFAVKEGDRDTLALLNEGLALVVADGTYRRLHARWFAALELPSNRSIRVGGDAHYPPFEFLSADGVPAGFNVDLLTAVSRATGLELTFNLGPWAANVQALERGDIDLVCMFYSSERDQLLDFSPPYAMNHSVAVVRKRNGRPPATMAELRGLRLVVQAGDIMHAQVLARGLGDQVHTVANQEVALAELARGQHDCALVTRSAALYLIDEHQWKNLVVGQTPLFTGEMCFAVTSGNQALLASLQEGLLAVKNSGEYRAIRDRWVGVYDPQEAAWPWVLRQIAIVAGPLLILALLALAWSWSLRRQVAQRTAELHTRETFIRTVLDNLPIGVAVNSTIEPITFEYMNDLFPKLYRTTRDALAAPGAFWPAAYQDPQDREEVRARVLADCASGDPSRMLWSDVPIQRHGEPTTFITARNTPIPGTQLMISTVWDVTERKRQEDALIEASRRTQAAVRAGNIGLWDWDLGSNRVHYSAEWKRQIGYEESELDDSFEVWQSRVHPDDLAPTLATIRQAIADRSPHYTAEFRFRHRTGSYRRILSQNAVYCDAQGQPNRILGSHIDITERAAIDERLRLAQKMESIGHLAGGVAHDFNNLLTGIMNYVDLCRDEVGVSQPIRGYLDEVMHDAQRSAELTRQLLAFARKQTIDPRVLDLNETVTGMLKLLRRLIGEDIELSWIPGAGLWPVKLDPGQVDQVLANLCVNARDAVGGAGRITIETSNVTNDAAGVTAHGEIRAGQFALLTVSDTGCGMSPEVMDHVFEPFFTTKPVGEGTGLGLATVYGIVKQNEGFINVYSELGKGTTFRVYLPRFDGAMAAAASAGNQAPSPGGAETILLVEDEKSVRITTALFLKQLGYTVLTAADPAEALLRVAEQTEPIHLLITDVVMPGMSGRDLAERLARTHPAMKCIFMSGYTASVIAQRGVLDADIEFIPKPFSRDEIARKVRSVLGTHESG